MARILDQYGQPIELAAIAEPQTSRVATLGKEAFEDRKIRIPQGDNALRADLHKLKKLTGPTGAPRFVAESDAAGHADRTWALFLALSAASGPGGGACSGFQSLPRTPGKDDDTGNARRRMF